jgi:hypothetical protein
MGNPAQGETGAGMRLLVLDIETGPHLGWCWQLWDQNISLAQIERVGTVLCFAAKWVGEKKVHYHSDHLDGHEAMVRAAWALIDEADAVIHYNGKAFDIKHLNREFDMLALGPPSPHKDIDLLTVARGRFKYASNKLEFISDQLGIGNKVKHEGWALWLACLSGDEKAWAKMRRYNIQDVALTERLYERWKPWIKNHPNRTLYEGGLSGCQTCGDKTQLIKRGFKYTAVSKFQQFQCKGCGAYSAATHREKAANRVSV